MRHLMLDLETLGTKPGCVIVSIGACFFSQSGIEEKYYQPIDIRDSSMKIDAGTVAWWMGQSEAARAVFSDPSATGIIPALTGFSAFVEQDILLWGHGASFDGPILQAAYEHCGMTAPFKFYNFRDTRTLYDIAQVFPEREKGTHHNALDDAIAQAEAVIKAYEALGKVLS